MFWVHHRRHLSMPFGGGPALPSGPSFARNITKLAPVAAVGEMRCAVVALTLHWQCDCTFEELHAWMKHVPMSTKQIAVLITSSAVQPTLDSQV